MKRLWKILSSRRAGHELLAWAAESKIGAFCVIAIWVAAHVAFACYAATGKGWFDRSYDSYWYWIDLGWFGFCLLVGDTILVVGLLQKRKKKNA